MEPRWFKSDEAPLLVFCRHPDCFLAWYLIANAIPVSCPGCSRQSDGAQEWWTVERPAGKPTKGIISANDRRFLKSIRIKPWDGGIDV